MALLKLSSFVVAVSVVIYVYTVKNSQKLHVPFGGHFHPDFKDVVDKFRKNLNTGVEVGASLSIFHEGEPVVDIWGGFADVTTKRPWTENTLSIIFSTTKGVTALVVALFVERGWLDYKKPVAYYWPEFGNNGKEEITVELLLSHQGGLSITNGTFPIQWIVDDPEKVYKFLERQTPYWKPGTGYAYHSITYGLFVDSLLTKADPKHRRVDQIFKDEIGDKFGIELYHGLPNNLYYRMARHEPMSLYSILWKAMSSLDFEPLRIIYRLFDAESIFMKGARSGTDRLPSDISFNNPEYNKIPQSSMNGYSNARNLAKLFGIIANGGKTDKGILLSEKAIKVLEEPLTFGKSVDGLLNEQFGRGVMVMTENGQLIGFGHPGYGGQIAYADTKRRTGFGYVTSRLKELRTVVFYPEVKEYRETYYKCLQKYLENKRKGKL
ncbi:beta-lactamase domain-containing protein 2-like [Ostrea edulis]|uniref:beta-lactamase domain-containing protein 2-like n=1 Tax=Ostrea edulis TaxID=37623 RepID=UPI0024AF45F3|nr:beta-lactamase domain-containing protein 2-like [Ostrea edulis]